MRVASGSAPAEAQVEPPSVDRRIEPKAIVKIVCGDPARIARPEAGTFSPDDSHVLPPSVVLKTPVSSEQLPWVQAPPATYAVVGLEGSIAIDTRYGLPKFSSQF